MLLPLPATLCWAVGGPVFVSRFELGLGALYSFLDPGVPAHGRGGEFVAKFRKGCRCKIQLRKSFVTNKARTVGSGLV
jgi:hypothetical protein